MLLITIKINGDMLMMQRKSCSIDFCHLTLTNYYLKLIMWNKSTERERG